MNVYLIGLPGCGKTTLGRKLSQLLHLQFIDTDDLILQNGKLTIENIFREKGEVYFRELERDALQDLAKQNNLLVATGGGMPCHFDNMDTINSSGISVFLDLPLAVIAKRLSLQDTMHRPLVKGKTEDGLLEFLQTKYKERIPYYSKSRFIFTQENLTPEQVAEEVRKVL